MLLACGVVGIEAIVSGGDDYEILCAIPPASLEAFKQAAQTAAVAVAVIGKIVPGSASPSFLDRQGEKIALPRLSYSHF
jgi:thiamine-monophosphate kinase